MTPGWLQSRRVTPNNGVQGQQEQQVDQADRDAADTFGRVTTCRYLSSRVRATAVIAALDRNGDGRLDPEEFRLGMGGKPRLKEGGAKAPATPPGTTPPQR